MTKAPLTGAITSATTAASKAFENDSLAVVLEAARHPSEPETVTYTATITNKLSAPITDFVFQLAVPKVRGQNARGARR